MTTRKALSIVFRSLFTGKKRPSHSGFDEFILFTRLTFNSKLDEKRKEERTDPKNELYSARVNSKWPKKNCLQCNIIWLVLPYSRACRHLSPVH